jgi:serine/threonine-protein kinase
VPEVPGTTASNDPVPGTGSTQPQPTSQKEPQEATGAQQVAANSPDTQPKVEPPDQTETPSPGAQDPAAQKSGNTNSAQENATPEGKTRSTVGTLQIVSRCWANVYVDGKPKGRAPRPPITLSAGLHRLRLVGNRTIQNPEGDIEIKAGETFEYHVQCPSEG